MQFRVWEGGEMGHDVYTGNHADAPERGWRP